LLEAAGVESTQMAGWASSKDRPAQFSFRQLPTSPAINSKSRIGVTIQGRDGAETARHESSCGYSPFISNGKISLK
jgi:hypothetical protein